MKTAMLAKSALNLDWLETGTEWNGRRWVCISADYKVIVIETDNKITATTEDCTKSGFLTVYEAMKWAESVWLSENGN